ncbi:hypothetical protein [Peribacillus butanolivorans]|uniref:hypothetical protein n=1 Tax=Peribacillus butanolivorans TaxID=421767 RepID=UPI0035DAE885
MSNSTIQQITSNSLEHQPIPDKQPKKAKGKEINPFVLMFIVIIIATVLTYVLPAGQYERVEKDGRTIVNPTSFEFVDSSPVGLLDMLSSVHLGMNEGASIILFVFLFGGASWNNASNWCIGLLNKICCSTIRNQRKSVNSVNGINICSIRYADRFC